MVIIPIDKHFASQSKVYDDSQISILAQVWIKDFTTNFFVALDLLKSIELQLPLQNMYLYDSTYLAIS